MGKSPFHRGQTMKNKFKAYPAAIYFALVIAGPIDALAMPIIPLPTELRFNVGYDFLTIPGPDGFNRNVATSLTGDFNFFNFETPGGGLLPSPVLVGQATQLPGGDLEVVIAGTSVLPGLQAPLDPNEYGILDSLILDITWTAPLGSDIQLTSVGTSTTFGAFYQMVAMGQMEISNNLDTAGGTFTTSLNAGALTGGSPPLDTGIRITFTAVPLPPAVWLFGSALGLLGWMRRKAT